MSKKSITLEKLKEECPNGYAIIHAAEEYALSYNFLIDEMKAIEKACDTTPGSSKYKEFHERVSMMMGVIKAANRVAESAVERYKMVLGKYEEKSNHVIKAALEHKSDADAKA